MATTWAVLLPRAPRFPASWRPFWPWAPSWRRWCSWLPWPSSAHPWAPWARGWRLPGQRGRLRRGAVQSLDGLPDPGHGALAVRELLDRLQVAGESGDAGKAVPDLDQAVGGPVGGELGKLLLRWRIALGLRESARRREGGDGVVGIYRESLMEMLLHVRKPACSGGPRAGRWALLSAPSVDDHRDHDVLAIDPARPKPEASGDLGLVACSDLLRLVAC